MIYLQREEEEEELRSSREAGVNRVSVRKTSLVTPLQRELLIEVHTLCLIPINGLEFLGDGFKCLTFVSAMWCSLHLSTWK